MIYSNMNTPNYFTFDDVLVLQYCIETIREIQEDRELYEQLNIIYNKIYDAYCIEKQGTIL